MEPPVVMPDLQAELEEVVLQQIDFVGDWFARQMVAAIVDVLTARGILALP